jgi:ATP-dependent exoDNAse (exonuclease V) beta subunit
MTPWVDPFDTPLFQFEPDAHLYTYNAQDCFTSATTVVQKWIPPFEEEYWAKKKAEENNVTPEDMIKEWNQKRDKAAALGTSVHRMIEEFLLGGEVRLSANLFAVQKYTQFLHWWWKIHKHYEVIAVEWRMFDLDHGIAGTVDLLIRTKDGLVILDWKTNHDLKVEGSYNNLLAPFDDLPENDRTKYALQLSTYRMMAKLKGIDIKKAFLVHVTDHGCYPYETMDLSDRILAEM